MAQGNYKHAKYIIQDGKKVLVSPGMGNEAYWRERSKEVVEEYFQKAERVEAELKRHYEKALREIKKEYNNFFAKHGEEGKNMLIEARKHLSPKEHKAFLEDIEYWKAKYMSYGISDKEFNSISNLLKGRKKIQRLEELNFQIEARVSEIAWKNHKELPGLLSDTYKGSRESMRLFFDKRIGVSDWNKISERMVKAAITEPWGPPMWSENIWVNRQWTTKKLKDHVTYGLIKGVNPKETARLFEKVMVGYQNIKDPLLKPIGAPNDNSYFAARRIIHTETKHILTKGAHEAVMESGVAGRYRVVTVLDKKRSKICEKKEGKIIELVDATPENMSPYHPFCRTFELFEIEGIDYQTDRTAADPGGPPAAEDWYKPVSSEKALEDLKKMYPNSKITIGRLSKEVKERTLNSFNKLSQMYDINNGKESVKGIAIASKDGHGKAFQKGTGGVVYTNRRTGVKSYGLNTRYFKDANSLKDYYSPGWCSIVDEDKILDHTTYHEFGHLIYTSHDQQGAAYKEMQKFFKGDTYKKYSQYKKSIKDQVEAEAAKARMKYIDQYKAREITLDKYQEEVRKVRKNIQKKLIEENKDYIPSIYSTYSDNELIAEAFAEYHLSSNPGKIAREIGELMDKLYRRK